MRERPGSQAEPAGRGGGFLALRREPHCVQPSAPSSVTQPPWVCLHKARVHAPVCGDRRRPAGPGQLTPPWCCVTDRTEWKGLQKPTDFVLLISVPGTNVFICRENGKKHIRIV